MFRKTLTTNHNQPKYKTRQKPSHCSWTGNTTEGSELQEQAKTQPHPQLKIPQKHQAYSHNVHAEDRCRPLQGLILSHKAFDHIHLHANVHVYTACTGVVTSWQGTKENLN